MLLRSGIKGFDELLYGGLIKNSAILVEGVPGAGKTTFGLEFIYKGIKEMHEPGIVITFEELPEQLYRDAANFGWDLRQLEEQNLLRVICTSPELIFNNTRDFLVSIVKEISAKRLLLDSITQFNMEISNPSELRRSVYSLCSGLKRMGLTSIFIKEVEDYKSNKACFEEYLVDTVIRLYFEETSHFRKRYIEILKSRGQDFISGKYPFKFTPNGLEVIGFPEIIEPLDQCLLPEEKLSSGIDGLDNILGGGFLKRSSIMIEGASGTGKTVMGIHYLLEGIKNNEKGLLLVTEESASSVRQYIDSFAFNGGIVWPHEDFFIMDRLYDSTSLEDLINKMITMIKTHSIQRVVIDFVNTFLEISDNMLVLKTILRNLLNNLYMLGCTTILILNEEQSDNHSSVIKNIIQPLVRGEIHLSSTVKKGKRYRSLEVSKMKGQKYITGTHLAEITSSGMAVYQRLGGV